MDYLGNELELFQFARNWKKYFSGLMQEFIHGDTLEVGAGIGVNTKYLINERVNSWTFVEPDRELAFKIADYTSDIAIPKHTIIGTIDEINSNKFDTIIYIDVLEHIKDSEEEIRKAKDLLNEGGHLIILVPAFQFLYNVFDLRLGHYRRYNKRLLKAEINSRLVEKKLFYLDSFGLMASIVNKYILKRSEINLFQVKLWDTVLVPLSKFSDLILFKRFGKSLIGIYEKSTD